MAALRKAKLCNELAQIRLKQNKALGSIFSLYEKPKDNCGSIIEENSEAFNNLKTEEDKILEALGDYECHFDKS